MKWRFRTNWRGKLILQVGMRVPYLDGIPGSTCIEWRDAKVEDLKYYYSNGDNK